jgi:hypothetical protein
MIVVEQPAMVEHLVGAIASNDLGEVGVVVVAHDEMGRRIILADARVSDFGHFEEFCAHLFDGIDDLMGRVWVRGVASVWCGKELFDRVCPFARAALPGFSVPVNGIIDVGFYDDRAVEPDPQLRALAVGAASPGTICITPDMAAKAMRHPFDALSSERYDPAMQNVLCDALTYAWALTMVEQTARRRAMRRAAARAS